MLVINGIFNSILLKFNNLNTSTTTTNTTTERMELIDKFPFYGHLIDANGTKRDFFMAN